MSVRFMIIDAQPDFRALLMHHLTSHWPDAIITAFDPVSAGFLPDEFGGAGNDVILLGDEQGDRDGVEELARFSGRSNFPAIVYFGDEKDRDKAVRADQFFLRNDFNHDALMVRVADLLDARRRVNSTGSLFVGDIETGIQPLIKGYTLISKLASTEHSAVYLAGRDSDGRRMVLKVLRQDPDLLDSLGEFDRFLQEYELIADVDHPNIVQIFDLGVSDTHAHIAMEYLGGGDLKQRIAAGVKEKDAIRYLRQIASALASIHEVGILHRDLKPANVMLRDDDSVALIDFGLAKRAKLELEITGSGEIFGTPYYMSPEQGRGDDIDHRSDIYSLGIMFYEMLTGKKPYESDTAMGVIYKHTEAPVPLLPPRLVKHQALLNLLMAKKPKNRLQSADELESWL